MASFRRYGKDGWRAEVDRRGVRKSATFPSKGAAQAWAGRVEAEIMAGVRGEIPNLTVADLFKRYEREVSTGKKGQRWESVRLTALGRDRLAQVRLRALDAPHASDWQRRRLQVVSGASVRRERNLLNNVFEVARREWKWLRANPFKDGIKRPKDGRARTRIATPEEIERLLDKASDKMKRVIVWALETGMRAGEIAALKSVIGKVAYISDSKNGEAREVPLSAAALAVWNCSGFGLTAGSISTTFARLCVDCGIKGLTFHDIRATSATRLSQKLNALQLAKMLGHKDLKQTMIYYRETTDEIARLL